MFINLFCNISQFVKLQIAGGNQDEPDCSSHLMPDILQMVPIDENQAHHAGEISSGPVENTEVHDPEV